MWQALEFMLQPLFVAEENHEAAHAAVAVVVGRVSSFLTKLVKLSLISRAKIMATGLLPFFQTRQTFWPVVLPLQWSGLKGVILWLPTCGPDLTSAAMRPPRAAAPPRQPLRSCVLSLKTSSSTCERESNAFPYGVPPT